MKSVARAILFTSFVAAATAAVGDKLSGAMGESENQADASGTPTEPLSNDATMRAEAAAPIEGVADPAAGLPPSGEFVTVTPSPSTDIVAAAPPPVENVTPVPRPAEPVARRAPARAAYQVTFASAFPVQVDEAGYRLPARVTYADLRANDRVMTAESAFPRSVDESGIFLIAKTTLADMYLGRQVQVAQTERRSAETSSGN